MKKIRIGILTGVGFILCVFIGSRIYGQAQIAKERSVPEMIYEMGEEVSLEQAVCYDNVNRDGYYITVLEAEAMTLEEFCEKYDADIRDIPPYEYSPMVYDVKIRLRNEDNEEGYINLNEWSLQHNASYVTAGDIYYIMANKDKGYTDKAFAIRTGTEVTMNVVYVIPEQNFTKHAYANIEDEGMMMAVTLYPTKKLIKLQK